MPDSESTPPTEDPALRERRLSARALSRFRAAMTYWIATTRPSGLPHTMPVWGVWDGEAFWFGTGGQKVKNLAHQPYAMAHVESGEDVAIVQGPVERVSDPARLAPVVALFAAKYVDPESGAPFNLRDALVDSAATTTETDTGHLYRLQPTIGHAWSEGAFLETNVRWEFTAARS